jgi:hypothetical protein
MDQSYINHKWIGGFLTNWKHMKNVQKHFQDFFMHFNLKDTSTSLCFRFFPHFRKMQKCFERTHCLIIHNTMYIVGPYFFVISRNQFFFKTWKSNIYLKKEMKNIATNNNVFWSNFSMQPKWQSPIRRFNQIWL